MKLARPDVFHPRIVLAGSPDGDDDGLVAALRGRGLFARWLSWDDPETARADLVILRDECHDAGRIDEFLAWTTTVPHLLNAPAVVKWNSDQRYLQALERRGVPTASHAAGWTALVFIGGKPSHAFSGRSAVEPDFELWDVGFAALDAVAAETDCAASELLYARADVTGGFDDPRLLRLDVVAPSLGWRLLDDQTREGRQREFALAVESALERLGLGPLSHRRP